MKRGAPQGIEIAPASDFAGFGRPNPSPASIFSKILSFRNCRVHAPSCLDTYNFLDSQRPEVIGRADEASHPGGRDNLDSFSNNIVFGHENEGQRSKTHRLYDHLSSSNCPADDITLRV